MWDEASRPLTRIPLAQQTAAAAAAAAATEAMAARVAAHESERGGDWIAPEHPSWSAAGAEGKRDDRRPFDDVEVWHREDDQK